MSGLHEKTVTGYRGQVSLPIAQIDFTEVGMMPAPTDRDPWQSGFDSAIDEAIQLVDAMRAPGVSNMAAPILLRIRAELIALREHGTVMGRAA